MRKEYSEIIEYSKKLSILFVEDDEILSTVTSDLLRIFFKSVDVARNGKEGLKHYNENKYDIVITDLQMPEMDGLEMIREIKQIDQRQHILVVSGHDETKYLTKLINLGISNFALKPLDKEQVLEIIYNISKSIYQERELEKYKKHLEQKIEERTKQVVAMENFYEVGKFSASIVHNLNSPIQTLTSVTETLSKYFKKNEIEDERLNKLLKMNRRAIDNITAMVKSITSGVRTKAYDQAGEIDLNSLIKNSIEFLTINKVFKHQIKKELYLKEDLPKIIGHELHFNQIFSNLFKNAVDAMENSEIKKLSVTTDTDGSYIIIKVSDTGCGITKENIDKIFSSDYTSKPPGKGTGLGLSITKQMTESYKGTIMVESVLNKGTTFTITLPVSGN